MDLDATAQVFREFVAVIQALRTPISGCPWDLEQNHRTLRPYLLEESYEVLDAIDHGDDGSLREELGDLLLQVVLHAQVADDRRAFSIKDVVAGITDKMRRRHPHVFGSTLVSGTAEVLRNWDQIKNAEARAKGIASPDEALARVPLALPALLRAQRLGAKAARGEMDNKSAGLCLALVREKLAELEKDIRGRADDSRGAAAASGQTGTGLSDEQRARLENELGEALFALCQLARRLGISAEDSLRACSGRFVERLRGKTSR